MNISGLPKGEGLASVGGGLILSGVPSASTGGKRRDFQREGMRSGGEEISSDVLFPFH